MGTPVNLGDAIAILTQIYNAYDAYRSLPETLRQALKKFRDIERECESLNDILASSRRPEHRYWPDTVGFIRDLEAARAYLLQFEPLIDETGQVHMKAKVKYTIKAKWRESTIKSHVATVERHRGNMESFKQSVLIRAAQDNIELSMQTIRLQLDHGPQTRRQERGVIADDASSQSSDRISILTRVSRSLRIAGRLESPPLPRTQLQLPPIIEASSKSTKDFVTDPSDSLKHEIASFIETNKLYDPGSLENSTTQDLEYIAELPDNWFKSQPEISHFDISSQSSLNDSNCMIPREQDEPQRSPQYSTIVSSLRKLTGDTNSVSLSRKQTPEPTKSPGSAATHSYSRELSLSNPASNIDESAKSDCSSTTSSNNDDRHLSIIDGVMVIEPWEGRAMRCRLKFIRSEGSLRISASTVREYSHDSRPSLCGITPSSLVYLGDDDAGTTTPTKPVSLIFQHAIGDGMSSFPKILHPSAEIGETDYFGHPYIIEFYEHQYFLAEGYPKLPPAMRGLAYAFKSKADRDLARQHIFGKELLASAGIATIQFDTNSVPKPCTTQASSLWKSIPSNQPEDTRNPAFELTITIQCSTEKKQTDPDCVCEFVVMKADSKNIIKVKLGKAKELGLQLCPLNMSGSSADAARMSGGVVSSNSTATSISAMSDYSNSPPEQSTPPRFGSWPISISSRRRSSSVNTISTSKKVPSLKCYIKFTEGGHGLTKAKERFLDALTANL